MRSSQLGWITVAQHDACRGVWYRMPSAEELEVCAGRDGDDVYLRVRKDEVPGATFDALVAVMQAGEWARAINGLPTGRE